MKLLGEPGCWGGPLISMKDLSSPYVFAVGGIQGVIYRIEGSTGSDELEEYS